MDFADFFISGLTTYSQTVKPSVIVGLFKVKPGTEKIYAWYNTDVYVVL